MDSLVAQPPALITQAAACAALGLSRASFHRRRLLQARPPSAAVRPPSLPRALNTAQCQAVLNLLRAPRFADLAPAEVYATLLDEGVYHCSIRTMYRILDDHQEVRERRDQARILPIANPNCWLKPPTRSGPGTSPS
jgi:putative transposase